MEIRLLKELFKQGTLLKARILPAPMEQGSYTMVFDTTSGAQEQITYAETTTPKIYKRYNGAVKDARRIGFSNVELDITMV